MVILNVDDDIDDREMFQAALDEVDSTLTCIQFESGSKVLEYLAHVEVRRTSSLSTSICRK